MANATTGEEHLITSSVFNVLVNRYHVLFRHTSVGKRKVNVHSCAGLVDLGNAETDPNLMVLETFLDTLISDACPDPFAQLAHVRPRAGCFKALSSNKVILGEISGISNQKG